MTFILGKKLKMTQIWKDKTVIPVTVIKATPNEINIIRTKEKNGYNAIQLKMKAPIGKKEVLREFRVESTDLIKAKDNIDVSIFTEGDMVKVTGVSKGKGFQGVVKRHGFSGGPKSHGQKHSHRAPGSIGAGGVQKVFKGLRMAGRTGSETVSVKNLKVVSINKELGEIMVRGAVPGHKNNLLKIVKI